MPLHEFADGRVGLQQPGAVADESGQPPPQLRVGIGGGGEHGVLGVGPQRARPRTDGGVLEDLLLQLLDPGGRVRVGAQGVHVGAQPGVVGAAQLVPRVGADLGQELLHAGEHPVEDPVVDPVRHPRGRGVAELRPEDDAVLLQEAGHQAQCRGQHLLVPVAVDDEFQHAGHRRSRGGLVQLAVDEPGDGGLEVLVPQQLGHGGQDGGRVAGQPLGPPRSGEEIAEPAGHVDRGQLLLDDGPGQEVLLHERAEAGADLVLLARDDRGVRDRQPHRVPEQCGDGEPVGQCADHRGLGGGPHVAHPGACVLPEEDAGEEHRGGDAEQAGRQPLHPCEVGRPLGVVERRGQGRGRAGCRHPVEPRHPAPRPRHAGVSPPRPA